METEGVESMGVHVGNGNDNEEKCLVVRNKSRVSINCGFADEIPARYVLFSLLLSGMTCLLTMQSIMPITILAMAKNQPVDSAQNETDRSTTCIQLGFNGTEIKDYGGTLEWSQEVQYYVVTSFYWTYLFTQTIGGIASKKFGTKLVVIYVFLISSVCNACIPLASHVHYTLVIVLQIVQGMAHGLVWPAFYGIINIWIPIYERNNFITSFQGIAFGTTIGQFMAGIVIARFRWTYVFYIAGGTGLLWCLAWYFLAYNSPEMHPRISPHELKYIQVNRGSIYKSSYNEIPWRFIFASLPMWAIAITSFGRMWLNLTIALYGPYYLKTVIGLDVKNNGLWSGLPSSVCLLFSFLFLYVSEKLIKNNYISLRRCRLLFTGISQIVPGLLSIAFGYLNCNIPLKAIIWCLFHVLPTASYAGAVVNIFDLSPNFASVSIGLLQIPLMLPSVLASLVAKNILEEENTLTAWKTIFTIAGVVNIVSYVFYLMFASTKVQDWDKHGKRDDAETEQEINEEFL